MTENNETRNVMIDEQTLEELASRTAAKTAWKTLVYAGLLVFAGTCIRGCIEGPRLVDGSLDRAVAEIYSAAAGKDGYMTAQKKRALLDSFGRGQYMIDETEKVVVRPYKDKNGEHVLQLAIIGPTGEETAGTITLDEANTYVRKTKQAEADKAFAEQAASVANAKH